MNAVRWAFIVAMAGEVEEKPDDPSALGEPVGGLL
jgi:hypothetical protein